MTCFKHISEKSIDIVIDETFNSKVKVGHSNLIRLFLKNVQFTPAAKEQADGQIYVLSRSLAWWSNVLLSKHFRIGLRKIKFRDHSEVDLCHVQSRSCPLFQR